MTFKTIIILLVLGNKLYVLFISASTLRITQWNLGVCPFRMIFILLEKSLTNKKYLYDISLKLSSKLSYMKI